MTFKTKPHRYSIGPVPTSRAHCRGCRLSIEKGTMRLSIHAFVRPNRGTTFTRHLTSECVGPVLANDVLRARGVLYGVCIDSGAESEAVVCAWEELEARADGGNVCSVRRRGQLKAEVRSPSKSIIGTMFGYFGGVEVGGGEQKEDS